MISEKTKLPNSQETIRGLLVLRNQAGAESELGHRLSTLIEQVRNYNKETDPVARANLERFIGWTVKAIQRTA